MSAGRPARVPRPVLVGLTTVLVAVTPAGPAAGGEGGDLRRFCRIAVELSEVFQDAPASDASPRAFETFKRKARKLLDRAERNAPPQVANDVGFASELTGLDPEAGLDPFGFGILEPVRNIKRFLYGNCGFETLEVTAREYEFEGIPKRMETGTVAFEMTNEGAEVHEMIVLRIRGDESMDDLLQLPESELDDRIDVVGLGALAAPGESDVAIGRFSKPGRYGVVCFMPVGTTSVDAPTEERPHTDEGMVAELVVKKASAEG